MQGKLILLTLLVAATALPAGAQQRYASNTTHVTIINMPPQKEDTEAVAKTPALATNIPSPAQTGKEKKTAGHATAKTEEKIGYQHVPLAGEKDYFGTKNEYVNDFVRKYLELHNKTLGNVQNNSSTQFSVIDNVLEKQKLPKELKYLAVIESALNHNAVSHAGAVGTWQLMSSTARMLGLSVGRGHDERRDLYKSTTAATKYLEMLYSQLNDWLLVIAAYNSGPVPVERAIERTGSHNFWDIKQYLPRETQGHVLAFIATASIFENLSKFISLGSIPVDFKFGKEEDDAKATAATTAQPGSTAPAAAPQPVKKASPYTDEELKNMVIVRITEPIDFEIMSLATGMDKKTLARWNPDYDMFIYNTYPTPYYNLRIPKDKLDAFLHKKDDMMKKSRTYYAQMK